MGPLSRVSTPRSWPRFSPRFWLRMATLVNSIAMPFFLFFLPFCPSRSTRVHYLRCARLHLDYARLGWSLVSALSRFFQLTFS